MHGFLSFLWQVGLEKTRVVREYRAAVWLCMGDPIGDMRPWEGTDDFDCKNRFKVESLNNNYSFSSGDGFKWKFALSKKNESVGFVREDVLKQRQDIYITSPGDTYMPSFLSMHQRSASVRKFILSGCWQPVGRLSERNMTGYLGQSHMQVTLLAKVISLIVIIIQVF